MENGKRLYIVEYERYTNENTSHHRKALVCGMDILDALNNAAKGFKESYTEKCVIVDIKETTGFTDIITGYK